MDANSKEIIQDFLSHSEEITESLYTEIGETFGKVPFILTSLSERKEQFIFNSQEDLYTGRPESPDVQTPRLQQ